MSANEQDNNRTKDKYVLPPKITRNYKLIYPTVKRGEVYWCDFGKVYGHEQGGQRPAIVVQNDVGNSNSPTTIVLACTTELKHSLPVHYSFIFSKENMLDYNESNISSKQNTVMAEQIYTVDKTRLLKFIGTMTPEFMNEIQKILDISLHLKRTL